MDRIAADYDSYHGPDRDQPRRIKLSDAQRRMLIRLATAKDGYELTPDGNRAAGRSAANWYRTAGVLERLGLATRNHSVLRLTPEGRTEANDMLADTDLDTLP